MRRYRLFTLLVFGLLFLNACESRIIRTPVTPTAQPVAEQPQTATATPIEATATPQPATQTPFIIVVTATPQPTTPPTSPPSVVATDTPTVIPPTLTLTPVPATATPTASPPAATSTPVPIAVRVPFIVTVPADAAWVDTGIMVQTGQSLIFSASGSANNQHGNPEANVPDPNGRLDNPCQLFDGKSECLMNGVPYGTLIGKIGDNEPFIVGTNLETLASVSGILYLVFNDNFPTFYDNSGAYQVTITSPSPIYAAPAVYDYDDFNDLANEGTFDKGLWVSTSSGPTQQIEQHDGKMVFTFLDPHPGDVFGLYPIRPRYWTLEQFRAIEAKLSLNSETEATNGGDDGNIALTLNASLKNNRDLTLQCLINRGASVYVKCHGYIWDKTNLKVEDYRNFGYKPTGFDDEHTVRIEIDPEVNVTFYIDGTSVGSYRPTVADEVKDGRFDPGIWIWSRTEDSIKGSIDNVRIGRVGQ